MEQGLTYSDIYSTQDHLHVIRVKMVQYAIRHSIKAAQRAFGVSRNTITNTALFMEYLLEHLSRHGVNIGDITIQTDNGKEFTSWYDSPKKTLFEKVLSATGAAHRCIRGK